MSVEQRDLLSEDRNTVVFTVGVKPSCFRTCKASLTRKGRSPGIMMKGILRRLTTSCAQAAIGQSSSAYASVPLREPNRKDFMPRETLVGTDPPPVSKEMCIEALPRHFLMIFMGMPWACKALGLQTVLPAPVSKMYSTGNV